MSKNTQKTSKLIPLRKQIAMGSHPQVKKTPKKS